jgi:N-acetylglucosamine kinase-like BadF-type ATPase
MNREGDVLGFGFAGSGSLYSERFRKATQNLRTAVRKAMRAAKCNNNLLPLACFGISGFDTELDCKLYGDFLKSLKIAKKYVIVGDEVIAHYAIGCGKPGIVAIAGTGSIAYGVNDKGCEARAGGWEWFIGDEGSAYDIARNGLKAAVRAYDRRAKNTLLTGMFMNHYRISVFRNIYQKIYDDRKKGKKTIALLAQIVFSAAEKGDHVALMILKEAGKELGLAVIAVARKLDMENDHVCVGTVGGVFRSGELVLHEFKNTVKQGVPRAIFLPPIYCAIVGAALLGLKESGVVVTEEVKKKIEQNLKDLLV